MQRLAEICIRRPIFATMLIMALVVVGIAAYQKLGVDRIPSVDLPTVSVRTSLPGAAPADIEAEIADEIEAAVNTVEGLSELRSISVNGSSIIVATFQLSRDIDSAAQDVRDRVQGVMRALPDEVDNPIVSKFDNDSSPVLTLALAADRPLRELTELADKQVKVQIERASGVGAVNLQGGLERAIRIEVDPERLSAYGLAITTVRDAVARQNTNVPGGNLTSSAQEQTLRTMGRLDSPQAFEDLVITTLDGVPIRLRDIATVEDGTREQRNLARLNGVPSVILEVRRQSGANAIQVIEGVKANLAKIRGNLPSDVRIEILRDQSTYIYSALHEINIHLVLGSLLACAVVLMFMRSWRSTIIAGVAIPTSVVSTFGMMWLLDFTLNSVTMLALVLMVGIVIDDAIVVLENIFRFIEEKGLPPMEAAREATQEIGLAVLATTLSLVVIFVPVSFMSSISGRFLFQFGITAAVSVMVSLLVSFTLTPTMSARLLKRESGPHQGDAHSRSGLYGRLERLYLGALAFCLRHRLLVTGLALAIMASSMPLYGIVKQEYLPSDVDEGEFELGITAPLAAGLGAMDQAIRLIDQDLRSIPGVELVLLQAGGGFIGGVNGGSGYVKITPHEKRTFSFVRLWRELLNGTPTKAFEGNFSQRDIMMEARKKLRKYKDLRISVRNIPSFNIGGGNWDIDLSIRGPDLDALYRYGEELKSRAEALGGIVDADTTLKLDKPELRVVIDRERAADLGVKTADIANALRLMIGGDDEVSRFRDEALNDNYDVQLRLMETYRNRPEVLKQLYVPRSAENGGGLVRLENVVTFEEVKSPSRIDRLDRQRLISLRAGVGPGYALADRIEALKGQIDEMKLPVNYSTRIMGKGRELEKTFNEFLWAFLLSVIFMYMILASQFESLKHPFTILLSLPLSVPFALLSLWLTENSLNLYSALGILVLFGVVKKNSILQVDHMNKLRDSGMEQTQAILQANRDRLRPILMTTLALVAGMLPLWLGTGPGAEERRAIAVVVIGGQSLSLLLTLLVTPVVWSLLEELKLKRTQATQAAVAGAAMLLFTVGPLHAATSEPSSSAQLTPSTPSTPAASETSASGPVNSPAQSVQGTDLPLSSEGLKGLENDDGAPRLTQEPLLQDLNPRPVPPLPKLSRPGVENQPVYKLSLQDAIQRALQDNLTLRQAAADVKRLEGTVMSLEGAYDPVVGLAPTLTHAHTPALSTLSAIDGADTLQSTEVGLTPSLTKSFKNTGGTYQVYYTNELSVTSSASTQLSPAYGSTLGVVVQQPLARDLRVDRTRRDLAQQGHALQDAQNTLERLKLDVTLAVQRAWWELVYARKEQQNRLISLELVREQLRLTEARIQAGSTSPLERAEVDLERSSREAQLLVATQAVTVAENALKRLLLPGAGDPVWQRPLEPVERLGESTTLPPLEALLKQAERLRPELKTLQYQAQSLDVELRYQQNQLLPRVDLVTRLEATGVAGTPLLAEGETSTVPTRWVGGAGDAVGQMLTLGTHGVQVGMGITFPLGQRAAKGGLMQVSAQAERLAATREQVYQTLLAEVRDAYQTAEVLRQSVLLSREGLRAAELQLAGERQLYEQGRSTLFLVLQRVEAVSRARTQVLRAEADHQLARASLARAAGGPLPPQP